MRNKFLTLLIVCLFSGVFGFGHVLHDHRLGCHSETEACEESSFVADESSQIEVQDTHLCAICTLQHTSFLQTPQPSFDQAEHSVLLKAPGLTNLDSKPDMRDIDARGSPRI